ncbi:hypothetical protein [Saccharothrix sp. HUAS TT1]|uniref:hypothetical protein n=1 Tax=unclassified Saccharothrix TaxID=2593673 RepID=UPI00345BE409
MSAARNTRQIKFLGTMPAEFTPDPRSAMLWVAEHTPAEQAGTVAMVCDVNQQWVVELLAAYADRPGLTVLRSGRFSDYEDFTAYDVAPGHTLTPADVAMNRQDEIRERLTIWRELRATLPGWEDVPLQVSQPHPLDLAMFTFAPRTVAKGLPAWPLLRHFPDVTRALRHLPVFEKAVADEMNELAAEFGNDLVWNVESPVGTLAVVRGQSFGMAGLFGRMIGGLLARGIEPMPLTGRLDLHLCYGDYRHRELRAPRNLRAAVALLNPITERLLRTRGSLPVVHIPAAYGHHDAPLDPAFYRPLGELHPAWRVVAGVVSGVSGPEHSLRALERFEDGLGATTVGVGTACGLGRTPSDDVERIMRTQVVAAQADLAHVVMR